MLSPATEEADINSVETPAGPNRPKWRGRLFAFLTLAAMALGLSVVIRQGISARAAAETKLVGQRSRPRFQQ